jgi:site-specific DNA-adenine methylase
MTETTTQQFRSPLKYVGGKGTHVEHLTDTLARGRRDMIAPFTGSGAYEMALLGDGRVAPEEVTLADEDPATCQVLLELQKDPLAFIRRVERDGQRGDRRFRRHKAALDGVYAARRAARPLPLGGLDLAFSKWYVQQYSYDALGRAFAVANAPKLSTVLDRMWAAGHLLRGVTIKCQHFRETLKQPGQVYLDPPYWCCTEYPSPNQLYPVEMTRDEHRELAILLNARPGPWVLSIDDHPAVRQLYEGDPRNSLRRVRVNHNMNGKDTGKRPVVELVIARP